MTLHYAFIDESGTVGASKGTHFLVVAVLTAASPRDIVKPIRRALKKFGPSLRSGEIKAADFEESVILRLLQEIAKENIEIVATVVDQQAIHREPKDKEEIYRQTVARTVRRLALRYPRLEICLDKRYTRYELRYLLEKSIRVEIEDLPHQMVLIRQENSSPPRARSYRRLMSSHGRSFKSTNAMIRGFMMQSLSESLKRKWSPKGIGLKKDNPPHGGSLERLTLSPDFSISRSISGKARTLYE